MKINPVPGIRILFKDHEVTRSPNAGWPMSTMVGILNVRLEKIGNYCLNQESNLPVPSGIPRSVVLMQIAAWISAVLGFTRLLISYQIQFPH